MTSASAFEIHIPEFSLSILIDYSMRLPFSSTPGASATDQFSSMTRHAWHFSAAIAIEVAHAFISQQIAHFGTN